LLCQYPNKKLASLSLYRWLNYFIMCNVMNAFVTMVLALPESKNVIEMGDDLVWISGVSYSDSPTHRRKKLMVLCF